MDSRAPTAPPPGDGTVAVVAATLQEAYRRVKMQYGAGAVILGSRTGTRRQSRRLGVSRHVEVLVQTGAPVPAAERSAVASASARGLAAEVARIEALVGAIEEEHARLRHRRRDGRDPLTDVLVAAGASEATVTHLLTRFTSETGRPATDRPAAIDWLRQNLPACNGDWDDFDGCHAFLGLAGGGRTELVLAVARELQRRNRRTLVLSILPAHRGEVRRLQSAASMDGYDAAVIRKPESIGNVADHLGGYAAVLLDLPDLDGPADLEPGGYLHAWLAANDGFHRHLVLPLDGDPRDQADLVPVARTWHCDWLALTRTRRTHRWGKVLDLHRSLSLPLSLLSPAIAGEAPRIAVASEVLDLVLDARDCSGGAASPVADK